MDQSNNWYQLFLPLVDFPKHLKKLKDFCNELEKDN